MRAKLSAPYNVGHVAKIKTPGFWRVRFQLKEYRHTKCFAVKPEHDEEKKQEVYNNAQASYEQTVIRHSYRAQQSIDRGFSTTYNRAATNEIRAYVAGFLDGDGSIIFGKADNTYRLSVGFFQSSNDNTQPPNV